MKRILHFLLILTALALTVCLTACGQESPENTDGTASDATSAVSTGDTDISDEISDGVTDASTEVSVSDSGKTDASAGKTDSASEPASTEEKPSEKTDETADNAPSDSPEDVPVIEFDPQDAVGTWVADSGDYIYVEITENQTVTLLFGNKNSTETPRSALATDLKEMGNNRWNVSVSFDGGESSRGYSMTLLDETTVTFGPVVGAEAQTYRLESES